MIRLRVFFCLRLFFGDHPLRECEAEFEEEFEGFDKYEMMFVEGGVVKKRTALLNVKGCIQEVKSEG